MRRIPGLSFNKVVGATAVTLLLASGGAYAAGQITGKNIKDNTVTSADIKNGTIKGKDLSKNAVTSSKVKDFGLSNQDVGVLFASVNADATVANSSGGVSGLKLGTGNYEIDFGRDISQCAFTGTVGPATTGSAQGDLNVADRSGNLNAVFVDTNESDGTAADKPFHLVVVC